MGKSIYIVGVIATIAIILLVLFTIKSMEDSRYSQINSELNQLYFQSQLDSVYSEFSDSNSQLYCSFLLENIDNTSSRVESIWQSLNSYKERLLISDYVSTKRNFLVTNILLLKRIEDAKKDCNYAVKPIVYFYPEDFTCSVECGVTENLLFQIAKDCNKTMIFPFPLGINDYRFTDIVATKYGVREPYALVINNKKFNYPQKKDDLLKELGCFVSTS